MPKRIALGPLVATLVAALILGVAAGGPARAASADVPVTAAAGGSIGQLVAFRGGRTVQRKVRLRGTKIKVGRRRCAVAGGTALAALARSRAAKLSLRDYGSCSGRAGDSGQLFVRGIGGQRNKGQDGWVYKVGGKLATAGAADPSGPFGGGRLRRGKRVTWFYCQMKGGSCQRTLSISARGGNGSASIRVVGYDDKGNATPVSGARVSSGARSTTSDVTGRARLSLARGSHSVRARKQGMVTSFTRRVRVR